MTYRLTTRTFLDDLPDDVRAAYKVVGNQGSTPLRNMVAAIGMTPAWERSGPRWAEAEERVAAAKLILKWRNR